MAPLRSALRCAVLLLHCVALPYAVSRWVVCTLRYDAQELGLLQHPSFQLAMLFCAGAMIGVDSARYGVVDVKPLGVLWGKYGEHFSPANTIMFDECVAHRLARKPSHTQACRAQASHTPRCACLIARAAKCCAECAPLVM